MKRDVHEENSLWKAIHALTYCKMLYLHPISSDCQ